MSRTIKEEDYVCRFFDLGPLQRREGFLFFLLFWQTHSPWAAQSHSNAFNNDFVFNCSGLAISSLSFVVMSSILLLSRLLPALVRSESDACQSSLTTRLWTHPTETVEQSSWSKWSLKFPEGSNSSRPSPGSGRMHSWFRYLRPKRKDWRLHPTFPQNHLSLLPSSVWLQYCWVRWRSATVTRCGMDKILWFQTVAYLHPRVSEALGPVEWTFQSLWLLVVGTRVVLERLLREFIHVHLHNERNIL